MIYILKVYHKEEQELWNHYVKSYRNWDIYYLYEYAYSFMLHGDGEPLLISYEDDEARFCYVVMRKDIAKCEYFKNQIKADTLYDFETPYGYGGPLCDSAVSKQSQIRFLEELNEYCSDNAIVSQFVRFHPLLNNHTILPEVIETRYLRDTIFMDTSSAEVIMANLDSKNRNMVRKAIKNNISIVKKPIDEYEAFIPMYTETMKNHNAEEYYTFDADYFESLKKLRDNACIFYAMLDEKPVSGAIMYFNEQNMHYHLSGTHAEFRKYAPGNLLLYEAACWCSESGIKRFHLGGGMSEGDSLFGFKKQFNKNGRLPFVVGRTIFDRKVYEELKNIRKQNDDTFHMDNAFMIQYRA